MSMTFSTAAVVLAAGEGTRFTATGGIGHKLSAEVGGRSIVQRAVDHAVEADIGPVYVVVGGAGAPVVRGVRVLRNPRWSDGMAASLHVALEAAGADGHDAVVVGLGDQPFVDPDAWRRVAASQDTPIAMATYDGERGHPVRLAASIWPDLPDQGEEVARSLVQQRPELVTEVPCPGSTFDVDTVFDLVAARQR